MGRGGLEKERENNYASQAKDSLLFLLAPNHSQNFPEDTGKQGEMVGI